MSHRLIARRLCDIRTEGRLKFTLISDSAETSCLMILASLELYQRLCVAHKHSMGCCAIVCITALILSTISAVAGVDQLFERSPTEQTWGERLTEIEGDDGFSKCYALVIGISDYFDGYADHRTLLDDTGLLLKEGLRPPNRRTIDTQAGIYWR